MSENGKNNRKITQIGTLECALLCAGIGLLAAIGFITIGFWKTLLILIFILLGLFIGGVKDKKAFFQSRANSAFPVRTKIPYKADDVKIHPVTPEADEQNSSSDEHVSPEQVTEIVSETVSAAENEFEKENGSEPETDHPEDAPADTDQ